MEGEIVKPDVEFLLTHVQTGKPLSAASDTTFVVRQAFYYSPFIFHRSDFGAENGVSCHTYFNRGPILDQIHNFFSIAVNNQ